MPELAARAYLNASVRIGELQPACRVPPELLAAIGAAESRHGTITQFDELGTTVGVLRGYATTGDDSDGGSLDGDATADWAVGPMQFTPPTWTGFGRDGDGDGSANPSNFWDAALGAAAYLCHLAGWFLDPWFVAAQWTQWDQAVTLAHQRWLVSDQEWKTRTDRRRFLVDWASSHPTDAKTVAAELATIGEPGPEPKETAVALPEGPAQVEAAARGYYGTPGEVRDDYLDHVVAAYRSITALSYGVPVSPADRFPG